MSNFSDKRLIVVGLTISCDGTVVRAFLWDRGSMVDLNTLISPGSSLQLANAMDINDRGEIDGIGVPPGVLSGNFITQGHGFLLIPCDENHPSVEGCDYDPVEVTTEASVRSATTATTAGKLSAAEMMMRFTSLMANRYRRLGAFPLK